MTYVTVPHDIPGVYLIKFSLVFDKAHGMPYEDLFILHAVKPSFMTGEKYISAVQAQLFRRSGNLWLDTTITDLWTLQRQNEHVREISTDKRLLPPGKGQ